MKESLESKSFSWRFYSILLVTLASFVLVFFRLVDIMLSRGEQFRQIVEDNRLYTRIVLPNRGVIFDRTGRLLARNAVSFFTPDASAGAVLNARLLPVSAQEAFTMMQVDPKVVTERPERIYDDAAVSHVIGYVGFINPTQADSTQSLKEKVGKDGVEKSFDPILRGVEGRETYEVSATGLLLRKVDEQLPVSGQNLTLSIDSDLSDKATQLLNNQPGSIVITDIPTGQILVLVSSPGFSSDSLTQFLNDPRTPLVNRALRPYPPGSVFKMIIALAGLLSGSITPQSMIKDVGEIKLDQATSGQNVFGNWLYSEYGRTEGEINVSQALAHSNDIFFYKTAQDVGPERIAAVATRFRLGTKTGIEIPQEDQGLIPTPEWKKEIIGTKWFLGDTFHMGIGQGDVLVTPLQINLMTATIARKGEWCDPLLRMGEPTHCESVGIPEQYFAVVTEGMVGACSQGGTAFPFFAFNQTASDSAKIACKTGTAEHGAANDEGKRQTHAWFTAFYPSKNPKVAITVMLESTQARPFLEGSYDAAPIAKQLLSDWEEKLGQ